MCVRLRSARLLLRPFRADDVAALARLYADPESMRYLGDGLTRGVAAARQSLAMHVGDWRLVGFGPLAVEDRASGAFVGRVGLWGLAARRPGELGWIVARERWGEGIAAEATAAAIDDAFTRVGLAEVVAFVDPANAASIRVAGKLGMRERGLDRHAYERPHLLFTLTRDEWRPPPPPAGDGPVETGDYTDADHDAVFAVYAAAVREGALPRTPPATHEMFRQGWLDGARTVRVARIEGRLAGCYFVRSAYRDDAGAGVANAGYLVDAQARGRGVGSAMLAESLDVARELGYRSMLFSRIAEGGESDRAYRARGFEVVGRVPEGLGDRASLLMWRTL